MTLLFLIGLALAWVAVFVPAAVRARQSTPFSSTERFRRGMGILATPSPGRGRYVVVPQSPDRLTRTAHRRILEQRRRRFTFLVVAVAVSFVGASLVGGRLWNLQFLLDGTLFVYVAYLLALKQQGIERQKVSGISERRDVEEVEFYEPVHATGGGRR